MPVESEQGATYLVQDALDAFNGVHALYLPLCQLVDVAEPGN